MTQNAVCQKCYWNQRFWLLRFNRKFVRFIKFSIYIYFFTKFVWFTNHQHNRSQNDRGSRCVQNTMIYQNCSFLFCKCSMSSHKCSNNWLPCHKLLQIYCESMTLIVKCKHVYVCDESGGKGLCPRLLQLLLVSTALSEQMASPLQVSYTLLCCQVSLKDYKVTWIRIIYLLEPDHSKWPHLFNKRKDNLFLPKMMWGLLVEKPGLDVYMHV